MLLYNNILKENRHKGMTRFLAWKLFICGVYSYSLKKNIKKTYKHDKWTKKCGSHEAYNYSKECKQIGGGPKKTEVTNKKRRIRGLPFLSEKP